MAARSSKYDKQIDEVVYEVLWAEREEIYKDTCSYEAMANYFELPKYDGDEKDDSRTLTASCKGQKHHSVSEECYHMPEQEEYVPQSLYKAADTGRGIGNRIYNSLYASQSKLSCTDRVNKQSANYVAKAPPHEQSSWKSVSSTPVHGIVNNQNGRAYHVFGSAGSGFCMPKQEKYAYQSLCKDKNDSKGHGSGLHVSHDIGYGDVHRIANNHSLYGDVDHIYASQNKLSCTDRVNKQSANYVAKAPPHEQCRWKPVKDTVVHGIGKDISLEDWGVCHRQSPPLRPSQNSLRAM